MGWFRLASRRSRATDVVAAFPEGVGVAATVSSPAAPLGSASGFAVVDVETTGLSPRYDRVVSIAVVLTDAWGNVQGEWATLVNPQCPVGATHIHGIRDADVATAPTFDQIAPLLLGRLRARAVVAHNAAFDLGFLSNEFARAGWDWPDPLPALCTLGESMHFQPHLDRHRLGDCCGAAGVSLTSAHSALGDARAAAQLFSFFVRSSPSAPFARGYDALLAQATATRWPENPGTPRPVEPRPAGCPATSGRPLSERALKAISTGKVAKPRLLDAFTLTDALDDGAPSATLPYLELLAQSLEDGVLSDSEREALGDLIAQYEISESDIASAHRGFVRALAREAVEDGTLSRAEQAELRGIAETLGVSDSALGELVTGQEEQRLYDLSKNLPPLPPSWELGEPLRVGHRVVFTGCESCGRDALEKRTVEAGLRVTGSVSRRTAVLVSDGTVDGTKARAATQLGVRIVTPEDFRILLRHRQPYVGKTTTRAAARATPAAPRPASPAPTPNTPATRIDSTAPPSVVRAWALANGYDVGARGRLHADIWAAYAAATSARQ